MIDFKKKLAAKALEKKVNPIEIYQNLDRKSEKGLLRPAQQSVLEDWFNNYQNKKDVIIKLHTGQGKTLIGLLALQSRLNQGNSPVIYLCPNIYLVEQTCEQAKQFGIKFCEFDKSNQLPDDFWSGSAILITHAQKLFNGLTVFGTLNKSTPIDSIVLDDSHACIETIQASFSIKISTEYDAFLKIVKLFETDLENQGEAKLLEIKNKEYDTFLPVPYWAMQKKSTELIHILLEHKDNNNNIKFPWELIKNNIKDCQCVISGNVIEISPYYNSIEDYGTFYNAKHRIFMSATTNNDAFFVRELGVSIDTVLNPLTYKHESWSGEKMILLPYFMNEQLNKTEIVNKFAPIKNGTFGIVAITPSDKSAKFWEECGASVVNKNSINDEIRLLKQGVFKHTLVI